MATLPVIPPLNLEELTTVEINGEGVFDKLMTVFSKHIDQEFKQNRIKGPEYSQVYLGGVQAILTTALEFLTRGRKDALEAQLLQQQILLAQVEVQKAEAELLAIEAGVDKIRAEIELLEKQNLKIPAEIALLEQQVLNLQDELLTAALQRERLEQETENLEAQNAQILAQTSQIEKQTLMVEQQTLTEVENTKVAAATECKLRAEYDLILANITKSGQENALLAQKVLTERAQTQGAGVDEDSVIGKQKTLYTQQAEGFLRDAEQKAAKIMVDSWGIRRSTDEGTIADSTNRLADANIGAVVLKMLQGIQAS